MKKIPTSIIVILLLSIVLSCNNDEAKKTKQKRIAEATNLKELKEKYTNYEFEDCDEFLAAGDEMIEVYIETINKAYDGDSLAKKDLDRFDTFLNQYDALAVEFSKECPEQFEVWADKTDILVSEASEKLFKIYKSDYSEQIYEYDEELDKELQEQVDKLNEKVDSLELNVLSDNK